MRGSLAPRLAVCQWSVTSRLDGIVRFFFVCFRTLFVHLGVHESRALTSRRPRTAGGYLKQDSTSVSHVHRSFE